MDKVAVRCYSGFTYAEYPQSFIWRGKRQEVVIMEKAWLEPGRRCFRVRTVAGRRFDLCYLEIQDEWVVTQR